MNIEIRSIVIRYEGPKNSERNKTFGIGPTNRFLLLDKRILVSLGFEPGVEIHFMNQATATFCISFSRLAIPVFTPFIFDSGFT
jgi:hypothetical protein